MRKPVLLIFTNACILILVGVLLSQSLFVIQRVASVRGAGGQVAVQRGGKGAFAFLGAGAGLKSGDVVRTGPKSWAEFGWRDGTRWKLGASSLLTLEKAQFNPAKASEIARFRLQNGQLTMRVVRPNAPASRFEIETPHAIASVRGSVFRVAVEPLATDVQVFQGRVEVTDPDGSKTRGISTGQSVRASVLNLKVRGGADQGDLPIEPAFLRPELQVSARRLNEKEALLRGKTEAGDSVTIDGAPVVVLKNGDFFKRVALNAKAGWKVESCDRFGAKTSVWQASPALTVAPTPPACP